MTRAAGLICANTEDGENLALKRALESLGFTVHLVRPEEIGIIIGDESHRFLHQRAPIDDIPGFLIRGIGFTLLNREYFRFDTLYALERRGKLLMNKPRCVEQAMDKCTASVILDSAGIPTPRTIVAEDMKHALAALELLGGDVVVKPVYGGQGTGIFRITEQGFGERVFMEMFQLGHVFYIQEYHPAAPLPGMDVAGPFDARVFVAGGRAIGAMLRASHDASAWRTNIHQGAAAVAFEPATDAEDLAVRAAAALGLDIAGVDLLHSAKTSDWIVLEVNSCPGWTGLSRVSDVDYPGEIARLFADKLEAGGFT